MSGNLAIMTCRKGRLQSNPACIGVAHCERASYNCFARAAKFGPTDSASSDYQAGAIMVFEVDTGVRTIAMLSDASRTAPGRNVCQPHASNVYAQLIISAL